VASQLWYFDRLYQDVLVPGYKRLCAWSFAFDVHFIDQVAVDGWAVASRAASRVSRFVDDWFVDRCVDAIGELTWFFGGALRHVQAGRIQYYACVTFGVVLVLLLILLMR
jgi:hypothetical protein